MAVVNEGSKPLPSPSLADVDAAAMHRDGYLVIPGFLDDDGCAALRRRALEILAESDLESQRTVFRTDHAHDDRYFLESGDKIRCFLEPRALDEGGELKVPRERAVNKIGHALHELDAVFRAVSLSPAVGRLARRLGFRDPRAIQSMYLFKQPRIGDAVAPHQDATYLYTEPMTVTGFWLALEEACTDNGCLLVQPGGHRETLRKRFRRDGRGGTHFQELDPRPLDPGALVPLEVEAGTLVVLHGLLPHGSSPNASGRSRHAYALHLIDGDAAYPADNWLQRATPAPPVPG